MIFQVNKTTILWLYHVCMTQTACHSNWKKIDSQKLQKDFNKVYTHDLWQPKDKIKI